METRSAKSIAIRSRVTAWSSRRSGPAIVLGALLSAMLGGCQPAEGLPEVRLDRELPSDRVWQSPHFAYHARAEDAAICGDLLAELERHFFHLQATLGFTWPAGRIIHYYKFIDAADYLANAPCPAGSGGCTTSQGVYAYDPFEQHELVHAYLWPMGAPPTVISEGVAVAMSCTQGIAESPTLSLVDALPLRAALSDQRVYDTGGRLVRYLIDHYGPDTFLRFYASLPNEVDLPDLDAAMRSTFGASVEEVWAATLETHASCPPPFACSRDSLPADGRMVSVPPICGLPSDNRTFDIASSGNVAIAAPAASKLGSCDRIPFAPILTSTYAGGAAQVGLLQLPTGRYYLDFPSQATSDLAVLEPLQPWAGTDCAGLTPFVVGGEQYQTIAIALPRDHSAWNINLRFTEPRRLSLSHTSAAPSDLKVRVCPSCAIEASACHTLELGDTPVDVDWQGDYVLHIDALSPDHADRIQIAERP